MVVIYILLLEFALFLYNSDRTNELDALVGPGILINLQALTNVMAHDGQQWC